MGSRPQGQGHAERVTPDWDRIKGKGGPSRRKDRPNSWLPAGRKHSLYATVFAFSAATATRFDSGWAASLASLISASVFFEASATYESNAPRK